MDCPYYNEHRQVLRSKRITGGRGAPLSQVVIVPWCSHENSPVPRMIAISVIGGAGILRCGGDLEKCQVK